MIRPHHLGRSQTSWGALLQFSQALPTKGKPQIMRHCRKHAAWESFCQALVQGDNPLTSEPLTSALTLSSQRGADSSTAGVYSAHRCKTATIDYY